MMEETRCTEIEQRLIELAEGTLSEEISLRFAAHLEVCPACAEMVREARIVFAPQTAEVGEKAPESLWRSIQNELNRFDEGRLKQPTLLSTRRPFVTVSLRGLGIAAALLLGIYLGSGSNGSADSPELSYEDQLVDYYASAFQGESAIPVSEVIGELDYGAGGGQ